MSSVAQIKRAILLLRAAALTDNAGIRALLELLRPANIVTALADVLAGYAVAGRPQGPALGWLLGSTACLYAGGVVLNDVFDRDLDRIERPERPIPSGRVSVTAAASLGAAMLPAGIGFAARTTPASAAVAVALAASIAVYDAWGKRTGFGPINMGLCRGLNLLMGIAAAPAALRTAWPLALLPWTYVCAVTMVSRGEVHGGSRNTAGIALALIAATIVGLLGIAALVSPPSPAGLVLAALLGAIVLPRFHRVLVRPDAAAARVAVRTGVLSLVLLDAALACVYAGVSFGAIVLATALLAAVLARLFPVT